MKLDRVSNSRIQCEIGWFPTPENFAKSYRDLFLIFPIVLSIFALRRASSSLDVVTIRCFFFFFFDFPRLWRRPSSEELLSKSSEDVSLDEVSESVDDDEGLASGVRLLSFPRL